MARTPTDPFKKHFADNPLGRALWDRLLTLIDISLAAATPLSGQEPVHANHLMAQTALTALQAAAGLIILSSTPGTKRPNRTLKQQPKVVQEEQGLGGLGIGLAKLDMCDEAAPPPSFPSNN